MHVLCAWSGHIPKYPVEILVTFESPARPNRRFPRRSSPSADQPPVLPLRVPLEASGAAPLAEVSVPDAPLEVTVRLPRRGGAAPGAYADMDGDQDDGDVFGTDETREVDEAAKAEVGADEAVEGMDDAFFEYFARTAPPSVAAWYSLDRSR